MKITFVQTGGTIDKDYLQGDDNHGYNFVIDSPAFEGLLRIARVNVEYEALSILKKDSLDMIDEDRDTIVKAVAEIDNNRIVLTHGTDTMHQTAKVLTVIRDKTIVLTGSMIPAKFAESDAAFNLGFATAAVQILEPGIYVALGSEVTRIQ